MKEANRDSLQLLRDKYPGDPRYDVEAFAYAVLDGTAPPVPEDDGLESVQEGDEVFPLYYEVQIGEDRWFTLCHTATRGELEELVFETMDAGEIRCVLYSLIYWRRREEMDDAEWAEWVCA